MNTNAENTSEGRSKLDQLSPEQQSWLLDLSKDAHLADIVTALKEHDIHTSRPALCRFLKKRRGEELVADGKELAAAAEALAEQGHSGKLRGGTLEVMRQKFFEKAAQGYDAEEARAVYDALVKEEVRMKELELEARKVAALEQQVRLQERRIEVEAMKARAAIGKAHGHADIVDSVPIKEGASAPAQIPAEAGAPCGEGEPPKGGTTCGNPQAPNDRWVELVRRVSDVLNRGGDAGERILEARQMLAEEIG